MDTNEYNDYTNEVKNRFSNSPTNKKPHVIQYWMTY